MTIKTTIQVVSEDVAKQNRIAAQVSAALAAHGYTVREIAVGTLQVEGDGGEYDPKAGYNDGPGTTQSNGE